MSEQKQEISALLTENKIYHLNKLFKIMSNYHHRTFINCFKWHVFQSLLRNMPIQQSKQYPQPQQWLYQSLLLKKKKTPQQLIELQFINMCASKIQNAFKAHIYAKRHRQALKRLDKFKNVAKALVKGWKTRQIFRVIKMNGAIKNISIQRQQILKECMIIQQSKNNYSIRKLEYLKNSLKDQVRKFSEKFQYLYSTGQWVFQPKIPKRPQPLYGSKWSKKLKTLHRQAQIQDQSQNQTACDNPNQNQKEQVPQVQQVTKKKRVRQMRDRNPRASKAQEKRQEKSQSNQLKQQARISEAMNIQSNFQAGQRPIKAKGVYQFDDIPIQVAQQPIIPKKKEVLAEKKQENTETNDQKDTNETDNKRAKEKQENKRKMLTRQKYDPRKAIQEEKRRKKEQQLGKVGLEPQLEQKSVSQTSIPLRKQVTSKSTEKVVVESRSQNAIKMVEKQETGSRNTVNIGKGKGKVEAKIDCWGNRKTNKPNIKSENNRMTYKMIHTNSQQMQEKYEQAEKPYQIAKNLSLLNKIKEQKLKEKYFNQRQEQKTQQQIQNQQQKVSQRIAQNRRQQEVIFTQETYNNQNRKLSTPLRQKMRRADQMRQREAHKDIQELQKVYSEQYQSRFQSIIYSTKNYYLSCICWQQQGMRKAKDQSLSQ